MAEKMEVTRTPDRVAGLEGLSRQLAGVMQFALQRRLQQEKQQQTLDAVRAEQAKEDERLDRKLTADFANLQTKMAQDALKWKEEKDFKEKELGLRSKEKELQADIAQLKNINALQKAQDDLRAANLEKKYLNSKEAKDANIIAQAKILYPSHEVLDAYERITASGYGDQDVLDNMLEQYDTLERLKKAYLVSEGVTVPEEYGPFRDQYRFGTPGISNRPPQSPFDFMGAGGREMVEPQPKSKPKLEY